MRLYAQFVITTREERIQAAIDCLKEICREIGCSGMSPKMCQEEPHKCDIIRKLCQKAPQ